jgi:hypothetical protein
MRASVMASYGYIPSRAEIDLMTEAIRSTWDEATRLDRMANVGGNGRAAGLYHRFFLYRGIDGRRISGKHAEIDGDEFGTSRDQWE